MSSSEIWNEYYKKNTTIVPYTEAFTSLLKMKSPDFLKGSNFLEIGCGTGNNLFYARKFLNMNVFGIDYSQNALNKCKTLFDKNKETVELKNYNAKNLGYANMNFDVVLDRGTIQHNYLKDAHEIVKEIYRVLKHKGIFISFLASEFHKYFDKGEDLGFGDFSIKSEHGIRHFYSKYEIKNLFSGFTISQFSLHQKTDMNTNKNIESYYSVSMVKE